MVSVAAKGLRDDLFEPGLDLIDRLAGGKAGPIADSKDVRVDGERLFAKGGVEDDVRGLSAHSGEPLELFASARYLAGMPLDKGMAQSDDIPGLGVEQADRLDRLAKPLLAEFDHLSRCLDALEKGLCRNIDAGIRRLGRQHHRDQQGVRVLVVEFGCRRRVGFG